MTRIIAGALKNRPIITLKRPAFRPTQERVKAVIFDVLGDIDGLRVSDLFAGSGNLGFEALSRGARQVTFVEDDASMVRQLHENARRLGVVAQVQIVQQDALRFAQNLPTVDLVLADPPYDYPAKPELLTAILAHPEVSLVLEADKFFELPDKFRVALSSTKRIGDTVVYFFKI